MTEDKARKRSIRTRMAKTGESYTAARRHVVKSKEEPNRRLPVDLGRSDESIKRGSGKTWDEWFAILDSWGAKQRAHTEIARYVHEEHDVSGWWAQTVTVGSSADAACEVSTSGPVDFTWGCRRLSQLGVNRLFEEFTDTRKRNRWLEPGTLHTRTSLPGKSARFDFRDGESRVHVYFVSKSRSKASVSVQHERLSDEEAVEEMRAFWKERLGELAHRVAR